MSNVKFRDTFHFIIQFECLQWCKPCNLCNGVLITLTKVFLFLALCLFQAGFKLKFSNRLVLYYFKCTNVCILQMGLSIDILQETSS